MGMSTDLAPSGHPSRGDTLRGRRRAAGHEDGAIRDTDDASRHAAAQAPWTRAEHDQPRGAQPGELDDASGGVSRELLAGSGDAGFLGDRERIGQARRPDAISASSRRW